MGNYRQSLTHLALVEAAMNLDEAGDEEALHTWAPSGYARLRPVEPSPLCLSALAVPLKMLMGFKRRSHSCKRN